MTASRRWLGRRPEGPGADALGKYLTAFRVTASGRVAGGGANSEGIEGGSN